MLWYIAFGSALGGVSRFLLGSLVQRAAGPGFPIGTLVVNLTGSFLLGVLLRGGFGAGGLSPELRAMLTVGFCGGYTTFSAFSYETVALVNQGAWGRAAGYVLSSLGLSLAATALGLLAGRNPAAPLP